MYQQLIQEFVHEERLPTSYAADATRYFLPLIGDIEERLMAQRSGPLLVGINGAQGTGKSTLAALLCRLLTASGKRVANLSIDDFYYSKEKREELAKTVHPLLRSRGVPGTHDVALALNLIAQLAADDSDSKLTLPTFDKSVDDRLPPEAWPAISTPVDVIILEGWFVGARPQSEEELTQAINELERIEDSDGRWRAYVNAQLGGTYQTLFDKIDMLVVLEAPGFLQVFQWRCLQEEKLGARAAKGASGLMDAEAIERFIQHFERLTRHCLQTLPRAADRVFKLDTEHRIHLAWDQTSDG